MIGDLTISNYFVSGPWYRFLKPRNTSSKNLPFQLIRWLCFCYCYDPRKWTKQNRGLYYNLTKILLFMIWIPIATVMVYLGKDR